jgi:hypothetical protein
MRRTPLLIVSPLSAYADGVRSAFQLPEMSDEQFAADARLVERGLRTLKTGLEQ